MVLGGGLIGRPKLVARGFQGGRLELHAGCLAALLPSCLATLLGYLASALLGLLLIRLGQGAELLALLRYCLLAVVRIAQRQASVAHSGCGSLVRRHVPG